MLRDVSSTMAEPQFAALVDSIAADAGRRDELLALLREDHALYRERSAATIVPMRGWVLLALERAGVSDAALAFVLEELDTGVDPYLVAAAARALRSYRGPTRRSHPSSWARWPTYVIATNRYPSMRTASMRCRPPAAVPCASFWRHWHGSGRTRQVAVLQLEALRAPGGLPAKLRGDIGVRCSPSVTHLIPTTSAVRSHAAAPRFRRRRAAAGPRTSTRSFWRTTQATGSASTPSSAANPRSSCSSTRAATIR